MALYIPHSIFHLARLLYVRPETFVPYYVRRVDCYLPTSLETLRFSETSVTVYLSTGRSIIGDLNFRHHCFTNLSLALSANFLLSALMECI